MWMKSLSFLAKSSSVYPGVAFLMFSVLFCSHTQAQQFTLKKELPHIQGMAGADGLGNIYALYNGMLSKYTPDGQVLSYSNRQWGPVSDVRFADPLNVLVFFKDFGNVVWLDRNISEKILVQGTDLHPSDLPSAIGFSHKNGFWAWFPHAFQLSRFDIRGHTEVKGQDLSLEFPTMGQVSYIAEKDDQVFVAANGLWIFDLHANFVFRIPHIQTHHFQVIGNKVFYVSENKLYSYDFFLKQENVFLLPETKPVSFFVRNNQVLYLQTQTSLKIFEFAGELF